MTAFFLLCYFCMTKESFLTKKWREHFPGIVHHTYFPRYDRTSLPFLLILWYFPSLCHNPIRRTTNVTPLWFPALGSFIFPNITIAVWLFLCQCLHLFQAFVQLVICHLILLYGLIFSFSPKELRCGLNDLLCLVVGFDLLTLMYSYKPNPGADCQIFQVVSDISVWSLKADCCS